MAFPLLVMIECVKMKLLDLLEQHKKNIKLLGNSRV